MALDTITMPTQSGRPASIYRRYGTLEREMERVNHALHPSMYRI